MHLQMVAQLVEVWLDRCIAGVLIKNWTSVNPNGVPLLGAIGTCYEWDQEKIDLLAQ